MSIDSFRDGARQIVENLLSETPKAGQHELIEACTEMLTRLHADESHRLLSEVIEDARTRLSPSPPPTTSPPSAEEAFVPPGESLPTAEQDELLSQAIDLVRQHQRASASLLQRRLRIGYSKATQLIDLLEQQGVIGPAEDGRPREVLQRDGGSNERR